MDVFVEQLIKQKQNIRDFMCVVGLSLAAILLLTAAILFFLPFTPLVLLAVGYGWWWSVRMLVTEYEYCVTNGDIDIDRIRGKSRRLRLVSVRGEKIESMAPYTDAVSLQKFDRVVHCVSRDPQKARWYFTYHSKKNGSTAVIFEPNDAVLRALIDGLSYLLQREVKKQYDLTQTG